MPHLDLRYSANLAEVVDMSALCETLAAAMRAMPVFPLGGIRVRALPCADFVVADGHPQNSFLDMELRMGAGRDAATRRQTGDHLFAVAQDALGDVLAAPHFALSLELHEIDPELSWKANTIHPRLRGTP